MRIGFIGDGFNLGGAYSKVQRNLAIQAIKEGHEITSCSLQHVGNPILMVTENIKVVTFSGYKANEINAYINNIHPDVMVHIKDNWAFCPRYSQEAFYLDTEFHPDLIKLILYTPVHAAPLPPDFIEPSITKSHHTITTTHWGREKLIEGGLPSDKVDVLYHGVDAEVYRPLDGKKKSLKERMGFDPDIPLIGMIGLNRERKDQPRLIKAMEIVNRKMDANLYLHTTPRETYGYDLQVYVERAGLKGRIFPPESFTDFLKYSENQLVKLINCFDIHALISKGEGFGMPTIESMACEVPCIVTGFPVHKELFGNQVIHADIVDKNYNVWGGEEYLTDVEDLAEKIIWTLENGKELGVKGREFVQDKFNWEKIGKGFIDILEKVVEKECPITVKA